MSERRVFNLPGEVDSLKYLRKLFQQPQPCLWDDETCMWLQTCKFPSSGSTVEQIKAEY